MFILTLSTLHRTHVDCVFHPVEHHAKEKLTSEMITQAQKQGVRYLGHVESAESESCDLGRTQDEASDLEPES